MYWPPGEDQAFENEAVPGYGSSALNRNWTESETTENKQSLSEWKAVVDSVAAFATATGGVIRIGVSPDGRSVGVQLGANTLEKLANDIKLNTDPPQFPSITFEGPESSTIVIVAVQQSPIKPVWAFGRPLKRVGRTNQALSREETTRLTQTTTGRTWDSLVFPGFGVDQVSRPAVEVFLRRVEQDLTISTETVLSNLKLFSKEGLANAAPLLFGENPQRFHVEAIVKCARFLGSTSVKFLDERTFSGTVFSQLDEATAFIARNTRRAILITGAPEHVVVPEYPAAAIREAVTNAICHRNYAATGTVQVRIYDDRLEIWNPALLPSDFPVDALYREHPSRPPNPLLAAAFHRARLIEHWGTGTLRMVQECEERGMPRPEFRYDMGTFIARFLSDPAVNSASASPVPDLSGLTERQRLAVEYILEHGSISASDYRNVTGVSVPQSKRDLNSLVKRGLLSRSGRSVATRYALALVQKTAAMSRNCERQ